VIENSSFKKKEKRNWQFLDCWTWKTTTYKKHTYFRETNKKTYFLSVDLSGKVKHVFVEQKNFLRKTKNTKSNSESRATVSRSNILLKFLKKKLSSKIADNAKKEFVCKRLKENYFLIENKSFEKWNAGLTHFSFWV
jgi:hypothetical protein